MNIITLNTWGGRAGKEGLLAFFEKYRDEADVFCLQEMWSAPYLMFEGRTGGGKSVTDENIMVYGLQEITALLPEFDRYFVPYLLDDYGVALFVRKSIIVVEDGEEWVHFHKGYVPSEGEIGNHARALQYVTLKLDERDITILNLHGLWNGKGKGDDDDRLRQSEKITAFIKSLGHPVVLCGDLNLLPDTESIKMLEDAGLRNLIKEYGITSTRTSHYAKPEKYADYVFVSDSIEVKDFRVLPEEVSDHAALLVEIL